MNTNNKTISEFNCWICNSKELEVVKRSNIQEELSSKSFSISDSNFGTTGEIHKCKNCGFLQCSYMQNIISFYENLEDFSYEATRKVRKIQMRKILELIKKYKTNCKLLDIGAGSGILVEEAINLGFEAEGVEPSQWLQSKAKELGLPVHLGTTKNINPAYLYDVVTIIDIIEHVPNPIELLIDIHKVLKDDGIVVVSTPDVGSIMAKLCGFKWWNFKIPHIGYFNKKILNTAFNNCGFKLIKIYRPSWYFTGEYFLERINKYFPKFLQLNLPRVFRDITIEFNLRDSMLGIYSPSNI